MVKNSKRKKERERERREKNKINKAKVFMFEKVHQKNTIFSCCVISNENSHKNIAKKKTLRQKK